MLRVSIVCNSMRFGAACRCLSWKRNQYMQSNAQVPVARAAREQGRYLHSMEAAGKICLQLTSWHWQSAAKSASKCLRSCDTIQSTRLLLWLCLRAAIKFLALSVLIPVRGVEEA